MVWQILLRSLAELHPVRVAVLRSYNSKVLGGFSLIKGTETTIPTVAALELEKNGVVEIREEPRTEADITRFYLLQKNQSGQLIKLPDFFYYRASKLIERMLSESRERGDIRSLNAATKARREVAELFKLRLNSILKVVQLGVKSDVIDKSITFEERLLLKALVEDIESFYNNFGIERV